jgi:hypothetical protein
MSSLHENDIADRVLDAAFALHRDLGPGRSSASPADFFF